MNVQTNLSKPVQNPLTLIMKIKSKADYEQLNQILRQIQSLPPTQNPIHVALTKITSVHFARFVFLENNTKLAVITTFDGDFDFYINEFINEIGDVFNQLLVHMENASPVPVQKYRQEFFQYTRDNNVPIIEPFYSAYPDLTVLNILDMAGSEQANASKPVQNPLTFILKIKSPEDYEQLNQILQQHPVTDALNKIATVHFARFAFLENNTKLAVITSYDGDFETYTKEFVREIGDVLNKVLPYMENAPPLPVQSYPDEFVQHVRSNNMPIIEPFYSAYPSLTVLDIRAIAENANKVLI
ncbi:hypothetical protein [Nostoc sp. C110]|uniref:hypothetical protein n=1 Tax=Nostoc sp. C110 TaxID=3349876 RepID=UPI00370DC80A